MFILLFLFLQVYTINGSVEKIEVKQLPVFLPIYKQFSEGDKIIFEGTVENGTGFQFDLMNLVSRFQLDLMNLKDPPSSYPKTFNDVLHLIVNDPDKGHKLVLATHDGNEWFGEHIKEVTVPPNEKFTVEIAIQRAQFVIKINKEEHLFPINLPLVFGTNIRLKQREKTKGKASITSLTIHRKNDILPVYFPRFRNAGEFSQLKQNAEEIKRTCNEEGKKKKNVYLQYKNKKCIPLEQPPSSGPYLELLPISYTQCPCECSNKPQQFAILRLFKPLKIDAEKEPQIVVFEDWPLRKTIIFHGKGPFTIEFFPKPEPNGNCDRIKEKLRYKMEEKSDSDVYIAYHKKEQSDTWELSIGKSKVEHKTFPEESIGSVKIKGKGEFGFA